jgi:hypothetical protein
MVKFPQIIFGHIFLRGKLIDEPKAWASNLKFELGVVKCLFPYTHDPKTQEFNHKMNIVPINLEANMGTNVSIHPHYGLVIFFICLMYGWK